MAYHSIVCVKQVPDTETRIRIAEGGTEIDPSGVKYILSPYDEIALEAALQTREGMGAGTVAVVSLGDASTAETLRSPSRASRWVRARAALSSSMLTATAWAAESNV